MILNRAYIKLEDKTYRNNINTLLSDSFEDVDVDWNDNIGKISAIDEYSFQLILSNILVLSIQDLNIKVSIIIVPYFEGIFIKYLDHSYNKISTVFDIFVKNIDDPQVKKDMDIIYNSFEKKDLDTIKAFLYCNQNSKLAAKQLFLHRNSFNYRLNQFMHKTSIDIRDYNSLLFLSLLIAYCG